MPRYFFNVTERDGTIASDEEGALFLNDTSAIEYANEVARDIAGDFVKEGQVIDGQCLDVCLNGRIVNSIYLRQVVKIAPTH